MLTTLDFVWNTTHASINFVGFQLVSPGLVVGSHCFRFGLLDEGSCGWKHGFELSTGYDIYLVVYYPCFI